MIAEIVGYIQSGLALAVSGALVAAGFYFFGLRGALAGLFVFVAVAAYQTGVNHERRAGEARNLQSKLDAMTKDRDVARSAERDALEREIEIKKGAAENENRLEELEAELERRPASDRCTLDPVWAKRLRDIR